MRILCITDDPGYGGAAINTTRIAVLLARRGLDVWYAATPGKDAAGEAFRKEAGIRELPIGFDTVLGFQRTLVAGRAAESLLDRCAPDVVLFSDSVVNSHIAAKMGALRKGVPYASILNLVEPRQAERFWAFVGATRAIHLAADALIAVSEENLRTLRALFALPDSCGEVIYNPCPIHFFAPGDPEAGWQLRHAHGIPDSAMVCFTAARYETRKGHHHLLRAIEALRHHPAFDRFRFVWAGPDPDGVRDELQRRVDGSGLGGTVTLLGAVDNVPHWLDAANAFILPSENEGMPLVISEAMARCVPVVATAVGGIPEQLGGEAFLVPDPTASPEEAIGGMAAALAELEGCVELRHMVGERLHRRARELFNEDSVAECYVSLLERCAHRPRGTAFKGDGRRRPTQTPFGVLLDFASLESVADALGDGWGECEEWGAWTTGHRARLDLPVDVSALSGRPYFAIRAGAYVEPGWPALTLTVEFGGAAIGTLRFDGGGDWQTHAWPLPRPVSADTPLSVSLAVDAPRSPADMVGAPDYRLLGLKVEWIAVGTLSQLPYATAAAIRRTCPMLTDEGAAAFLEWLASNPGIPAPNLPDSDLADFLIGRALSAPAVLRRLASDEAVSLLQESFNPAPTPVSLPLTRLAAGIYRHREDLRNAFDLSTPEGSLQYMVWYYVRGIFELGLDAFLSSAERRWLAEPATAPIGLERQGVNGVALLLWLSRPDLQQAFPLDAPAGCQCLMEWLACSAPAEYPQLLVAVSAPPGDEAPTA